MFTVCLNSGAVTNRQTNRSVVQQIGGGLYIRFSLPKGGYPLVTLPRTVTSYRDSVDGTRDRLTYQKLVTRKGG